MIDEIATLLTKRANHAIAVDFLNKIECAEKTKDIIVVEIDRTLFEEAKKIFRQYDSANLSFTDCTSFAVCRKHRIDQAFAFDQDFAMMNITLIKP